MSTLAGRLWLHRGCWSILRGGVLGLAVISEGGVSRVSICEKYIESNDSSSKESSFVEL